VRTLARAPVPVSGEGRAHPGVPTRPLAGCGGRDLSRSARLPAERGEAVPACLALRVLPVTMGGPEPGGVAAPPPPSLPGNLALDWLHGP